MWGIMEEFNISIKIVQDLLAGIKSDIKERVELNSKKVLLTNHYTYSLCFSYSQVFCLFPKVF